MILRITGIEFQTQSCFIGNINVKTDILYSCKYSANIFHLSVGFSFKLQRKEEILIFTNLEEIEYLCRGFFLSDLSLMFPLYFEGNKISKNHRTL